MTRRVVVYDMARIMHVLHAMTTGKRLCVYLNATDYASLEARMRETGLPASRVFAHLLRSAGRLSMPDPPSACPSVQPEAEPEAACELDGCL